MVNHMLKRWLPAVLALTMMTACSWGRSEINSESGAVRDGKESTEKVTFTYFKAGSGKDINTNRTTIGKKLEEQTGVNFKIEYLVGDINTKIGTMIASNKYPDVMVPDGAIDKIVDAGAFIPLNDLIDQYGPNIKRVYESYYNLMKEEDGNIYFLPMSAVVGDYLPNPNVDQGAFWIQRRVLKETGYPKITTLDEYMDLIKQYADKYKDEGLTGFLSLTYDDKFFTITNPAMHLAGYPNDGAIMVDMQTQEAKDYGLTEETKRWMQKLNEMNSLGLFDKSSFVDNYDQYLAKVTSGKVLGFFDYAWQVGQEMNNLKEAGNDDLRYMALPIVYDANTKDQYTDPPSFVNNRGIGITVSAEDPVRIIQFFDNLLTDENQILSNWGIEGETYEVDDKGRFTRSAEMIQKTDSDEFRESFGFKYFEYSWPRYGNGSTLPDGNSVGVERQPEVAQFSYTGGDKLILEKYGVETFSQLFAAPDERPWYPAWSIAFDQGSPTHIYGQKRTDLQKKYVPKLVLSSPSDFNKLWDEYVKEFNKLDVKDYEQTMTEEVRKKAKLVQGE